MSSQLSICIVHSFHHNRGGDTTYTNQFSQLLREQGHTVYPFAMHHPHNDPSVSQRYFAPWTKLSQGTKQNIFDIASLIWSRKAQKSFTEALDQLQPNIIHIQHLHRHLTPAILQPARERGIPIVWTLHDYELLCPSGKMLRAGKKCTKCAQGTVLNAALHRCKWNATAASILSAVEHGVHRLLGVERWIDAFICPSQFLATQLQGRVPTEKIHHYPNPVSVPPYTPPQKQQWMVAGRLTSEKGFDIAIQAAQMLPEYKLLVCGDGPQRKALEDLAAGAPNIQFLGMLPHAHVQKHIKESQIVAVPSCWPENFPYAVIEAQALGRPVVGTNMGGIPEQIKHQETGLLIPPNSPEPLAKAIKSLFDDPQYAAQIGQRAHKQVSTQCEPQKHRHNIEELYTQLISRNDKLKLSYN